MIIAKAVYWPGPGTAPKMVSVYEQVATGYATNLGILEGQHLFHPGSLVQAEDLHQLFLRQRQKFQELYEVFSRVSLPELHKP